MHDVCHYVDEGFMFEGSIEYASFHVQRIAEAKIQTKFKHMSKWEIAKIILFLSSNPIIHEFLTYFFNNY